MAWPSLKSRSAGMLETPSSAEAWGSASELSFRSLTSGSSLAAAAAKFGAIARHGPHQGAHTSTSTAAPLVEPRWARKALASTSVGWEENRLCLQRPHLAAKGSLPSGAQLAAPQAGQTNWRIGRTSGLD